MKTLLTLIAASCCAVAVPAAFGGTQTGKIKSVYVRNSDGLIWFDLNPNGFPPASGRPACAAGTAYWIVPNENTDTGRRLYAMLLSAFASGHTVQITGSDTCGRWPDGEDVDNIGML